MLSPAAHYAGRPSRDDDSTSVTEFFKPGGEAEETLVQATALSNRLAVQNIPQGEVVGVNDTNNDNIDGVARDFLPASNNKGEYEFGNEAHGTSPLASIPSIQNESSGDKDNEEENKFVEEAHGKPPPATTPPIQREPVGDGAILPPPVLPPSPPPPRATPALKSLSFALVKNNAITTMDNAIEIEPDFFEGTDQNGKGPGSHFITMSFIKDKSRTR